MSRLYIKKTSITIMLSFLVNYSIAQFNNSINQIELNVEKIQLIDEKINTYRIKRDYIKSNPIEDSIAISENWYQMINNELGILFNAKRNIIQYETGKRWISEEEFNLIPAKKQDLILNNPDFYIVENKE